MHAGKTVLGQGQGVDPAPLGNSLAVAVRQLPVDEAAIEARVVGDERRIADKLQKCLDDVRMLEPGLAAQKC